jgi:hypothetical protein
MPEFEEGFVERAETVDSDEAAGESSSDVEDVVKTQARYSLRRGRLPHVQSGASPAGNPVSPASVVDVTRDAIGSRVDGERTPQRRTTKKSTEIVGGDRDERSRKTETHGTGRKNAEREKDDIRSHARTAGGPSASDSTEESCKKTGRGHNFAAKFLKFFTSKFTSKLSSICKCRGCGDGTRAKENKASSAGKRKAVVAGRHHGKRIESKRT